MEPAPLPPPNWFGRNWKWVVPVGCLLPVLLVGGCALMVFFFATGLMKQSDAYKTALARAQANSAVIEAIGSPISQTGIVSGNSNVNGPTGEANLSVPLSGPKGKLRSMSKRRNRRISGCFKRWSSKLKRQVSALV